MNGQRAGQPILAVTVACGALLGARCQGGPPPPPKVDVVAELRALKVPGLPAELTPEQVADIERAWDGPGKWFVRTGCFSCHAVSVYDVKPLAPVGPDLSIAVEEVRSRFGRSIEEFMNEPTGTMQLVFNELIKLTPEQKAEALRQLHAGFAEHERKAGTK